MDREIDVCIEVAKLAKLVAGQLGVLYEELTCGICLKLEGRHILVEAFLYWHYEILDFRQRVTRLDKLV